MQINGEVLEAAAKAAYVGYNSDAPDFDAAAAWDDMSGTDDWEQQVWETVARATLEAAAPSIAAQAWDEGRAAGSESIRKPNPHRISE